MNNILKGFVFAASIVTALSAFAVNKSPSAYPAPVQFGYDYDSPGTLCPTPTTTSILTYHVSYKGMQHNNTPPSAWVAFSGNVTLNQNTSGQVLANSNPIKDFSATIHVMLNNTEMATCEIRPSTSSPFFAIGGGNSYCSRISITSPESSVAAGYWTIHFPSCLPPVDAQRAAPQQ